MHNFIIVLNLIRVCYSYFDLLSLDRPYSQYTSNEFYNYGYWFKYQPLIQSTNNLKFGNSSTYTLQNQYLLGFELRDTNTLSLWHYQTDTFNHIVKIFQKDGIKSFEFQQDQLKYEGEWKYFGIQVINDHQYQILFYSNSLQIITADGILDRLSQQNYYIGCFGQFFDVNGQQIQFQHFQGRLTNFIELYDIISESNFEDIVISDYRYYINSFDTISLQQYFDSQNFNGQLVQKYSHNEYREGIRYGITMWVKSNIEQYTLALNYTILRATLNEYYTDNYLGDKQLLIQYQVGIVPSENIVYVSTYSFMTPIYGLSKKNDKDVIKFQDEDLISGLKQWHFIQFEYGRSSITDVSYNSLFILNLPIKEKQFSNDWSRDNHHFTGVPIYFYLGGGLSQYENKFIGIISKFTFISYNTEDMDFKIQCDDSCLTCIGPTSSDCLTCATDQNKVFSLNQCVCKPGYVLNANKLSCQTLSILYPMIQILETAYNCPEGYDQCENEKIVCSFGYFLFENQCFQWQYNIINHSPQQPSEYQDNIINCLECVFIPTYWRDYCSTKAQLEGNIFSYIKGDYYYYYPKTLINHDLYLNGYFYPDIYYCQEGYGFNYQTYECNKCFNDCLNCYINQDLTQQCNKCPKQYSLTQNICVKCGTYCEQCDQDNCLVCENRSFQTLDKINCIQCSIQNCKFCYQYYQDQEQMLISLDLKYQQIDISTVGIITSCARCEDGYAIDGERCIQISSLTQFQIQSCLTGILQNDNFQCLIGFDNDTALQLNNCQLIKNCYSCLMRYPIDPWCIQCVNGYYVQLEDGSCVACPDSCAGCIQYNSIYKDSWKVSIRALYFYKFGSHKYEDFAIDNQFKYEIICTECKDNFILFEKSCIPGCNSNCEICVAENGKAVCKKCRDNQYGALRSLDSNFQCIECPHNCNACVTRNSTLWKELNNFLEPSKYFSYDHFCYSYDLSFFLDNELNLPVKCDNSKKCFKSLVITINLYCDLNFQKIISNCQFVNIQVCLQNIFNDGLIDYIKKEVIKEVEIIFILKFSSCTFSKIITISQNLKSQVFSISQITLIIQAPQQTTLRFRNNIIFNNFDNYNINNITIIGTFNIKFEISGKRIKFESIILESFSYYFSQNYFIFNDIISLNINNLTILADYRIRYKYLIEIRNLSAYTYKTDIVMSNILINQSKFFDQGILSFSIYDVNPTLMVTNLTIISTTFENCFSLFNFTQGVQISSIMRNLSIMNNQFLNSSLIQWIQTSGQPVIQLYFKSNEVINSIVIMTPVIDLINSTFIQNQLFEKSILIQSNTLQNQSGSFNFQQLIIQQNYYKFGSQFICINQMENSSISVNFDVYFSIDNVQDFINNQLSYELSLIYINITSININNFTVSRKVGIIELAIIQSQQIYINNLKIENNQKNNIIYGDQQCLQEQQNIIIYIFDTLFIQIDNFQILSLGSIDYSIIVIQSQSVLKKQQNETIVLQNGVISNNQLVVSLFNKQISVIEIVSLQQQEINCRNIIFERNTLNVYVQNLQMQSSSTILIQSDQGKVQFENCQFKQNYVINSTNSPFYVYSNQILIKDTYFINNNIFDIEIYKKMLVLNYLDKVSIEQIQLRDFPIQSNGGSGSFKAQSIHIQNINIQGSYGLNGGSFYIITVEKSTLTINNATIKSSCTSDDINSKGGALFIDGSKSNLIINLKDIFVSNAKSRQQGGFMYLISLDLSITITNINCINCFSINGGFIYIDPQIGYDNSVKIINISLSNPDFRWFIQSIINITTEEQAILQRYSFLIYLPESILSVNTLRVTDGNFFGILYFKGNQGLIVQGLLISNYRTFQNSLVTLIHPQVTQDIIKLNDIQIYNISQEKINQIVCKPATMTFDTYQRCQQVEQILQAFSYLTQSFLENNYNCNYQNIYQDLNQSKALFEVFNFTTNKLVIDNMQMNNASTRQQDFGIISIRDFNGINNQVQINNIQIINNSCGIYGCLLITSQSSSILDKNKRLLSLYESINQKTSSILLQNSKFINNQAIYGSGIYIQNVSIIIVNTLFMNNSADLLGGAIYLTAYKNSLMLINNQIINNKAANQSGSGVYLNGLSMPKLDGFQNIFLDNQQDFNEIPQKLQIVVKNKILNKFIIKQDSEILIEQVKIVPYQILGSKQQTNVINLPSGQSIKDYQYFDKYNQEYIPYNLSLQFIPINRFEQQLYDQQFDLYISARTNKNNFSKQYFSKNVFTYDNLTQSFNLDDLIIYFSPYEQNNLEIKVESPGIKIPKYSSRPPFDIDSYKSYELRFMIRTFKCQLGQFYNENLQCCEQCTGNTYSVQLNSRICVFKDDNFINEVNSAKIQLKLGYWRAYVYSSKIDPCYHLEENCIGGWGTGDQLCSLGHIGALCEQCDLYDIRGSGSYSVSSEYQCGACSESKGNIFSVILISSWTMLSIVMTVQSTIDLVNNQIQKRKLIKLGLNFQDQKPNPAVLIKVLSNYLQIIITITTFQLKVPQGISTVFVSAGNPISTMAYSLDCFLISLTSINIIYFRIIWGILLAFSYIFLYQSGYFILVLLNKTIFNISAVTTCFIYLYVYLQPNLIQSLIQLVSFRNISGQQWIAGNVSYRYDTNSHVNWLITFVVPSLIIIGIMIPIILFIGLYKNRKNLNQPQNRQIWGYLYNEYKLTTYYWETIKIVQKEFIIIVLAYYEDYIPIKAALVFISLFLYSQATQISQPYNQCKFNKIDTQSTTVCAVSIILATTIYTAQSQQLIEIVWPFYIIISTLNTLFLLKLLWILFYAYGQKLESQLDQIRDKIIIKFPNTFDKFPFLKAILENQQQKKRRIFKRFQLIRQFLIPQAKLIIDIKSQSKNMVTTNSKEKEYRQTSYIQYKDVINSPLSQENKLLSDEVLIKNQTQNDQ